MTFFHPVIKISLFVATQDKNSETLPSNLVDQAILNAETALFAVGATGFTTFHVEGGWKTNEGVLIREVTHIVTAFVNGINEVDVEKLTQWAETTKTLNNQDSVLFTIERLSQKTVFV
jgi:hypothetical protein